MAYVPNTGSVVAFQSNPGDLHASVTGTVAITGSLVAVQQSSVAVNVIAGSIAASFTPPANQSVSGTVTVDQGTNPWIITGSVQTTIAASNSSVQVLNFPASQSVSGTVGASVVGIVPVRGTASVGAAVGDFPLLVGGADTNGNAVVARYSDDGDQIVHLHSSVVALVDNGPNQVAIPRGEADESFMIFPAYGYVFDGTTWDRQRGDATDGTLVNLGTNNDVVVAGSVATVIQGIPTVNTAGSVVAFQGTDPWIITGSIQGSFSTSNSSVQVLNFPAIQDIAGSVVARNVVPSSLLAGVSVIGLAPVSVSNFPTNQNVSGSVAAFVQGTPNVNVAGSVAAWLQSTNASVITVGTAAPNQSVSGTVGASVIGTVPVTQSGTIITSLVSTVPSSVIVGASIFGLPPVNVTNFPTNQNVSGSVAAWLQSTNASVITVGTAVANQSVSGTVDVGNFPTSQNINGSVVSFQGTNPWIITGSVQASLTPAANQSVSGTVQTDVRGSVGAVIIGGSIATATTNSSVVLLNSANVIGSVAALQGTDPWTIRSSIAGGIFPVSGSVAATITNTNVDISGSVAAFQTGTWRTSIAGTPNVAITSIATANGALPIFAPLGSRTQGVADLRVVQGASVVALTAPGASIRNYVDHVQVANLGSASVLVVIRDNTTSTLGWTIAPAGGGSNINCFYRGAANSPITASISGTASVLVSMQGFTSAT